MLWLCLLLLPALLSANSTLPESGETIETPDEFYRSCAATKSCLKVLRNGLDQFWNLSLSAEEAEHLNENYTDAAEYANLPAYVIDNSHRWPKAIASLFTGSCPYLSYAVRDELLAFGYRGCSFELGEHCLFMIRPNETKRLYAFSAECDVGNQAVKLCEQVDEQTGYYCNHTIWNGVYKGTECCSRNGYNVFESIPFRGFFNSTAEVDSILKASLPHLAKMGKEHVKISAVWRWTVLGVGLAIYAGIIGLVHFVYWKIQV